MVVHNSKEYHMFYHAIQIMKSSNVYQMQRYTSNLFKYDREKFSESCSILRKGNSQKKYWNNGIIHIESNKSPGHEWVRGKLSTKGKSILY